MNDSHTGTLLAVLVFLIFLAAFFSAAEIGMMTLNRYRLRHLANSGHRAARIALRLLERPDRLLGVILLGNNFANIAASSVATLLALRLYGESAIGIVTGLLTLVVLVLAEVAPKTVAALYPERVAFPVAYVLGFLLKVLSPLVWLVNIMANGLLRLLGFSTHGKSTDQIGTDELRTVVREAGAFMPQSHQQMLLAVLDLENMTVEDVMVPRGEIEIIDLDADWDHILTAITTSQYSLLPICHGSLDHVVGIVHVRKVLLLMRSGEFRRDSMDKILEAPYFVPEGTPLGTQLLNFRETKRRIALVVDEYGDVVGLVSLREILEEIVGEFTAPTPGVTDEIQPQDDGSYMVSGSITLRDLNRRLEWDLPTTGPKTLNGLITEYLEDIPQPGTSMALEGYQVEIVRTRGTAVQLALIRAKTPKAAAGTDASRC
ncbi:MAG: HlyC/CorC family transporter [Acidiferrobacterales bacterium]